MASELKNLSVFDRPVPPANEMSFGIVVAEWNHEITSALLNGAVATLRAAGCADDKISVKWVPGTFELAMGAQYFAEYTNVDAVIVLGCVIQGDTRHFDFVCQGVTSGVQQMQLSWNMPIAFEPPPTQATTASGSLFFFSYIAAFVSLPITLWNILTRVGKGCGPAAVPKQ